MRSSTQAGDGDTAAYVVDRSPWPSAEPPRNHYGIPVSVTAPPPIAGEGSSRCAPDRSAPGEPLANGSLSAGFVDADNLTDHGRDVEKDVPRLKPWAIVRSSPAVGRLCVRFHDQRGRELQRQRAARWVVAAVGAVLGAGAATLMMREQVSIPVVAAAVATVAMSAIATLGVLAAVWSRTSHRLSVAQGPRFLRALQIHGELSVGDLRALGIDLDPAAMFTECYDSWRTHERLKMVGGRRVLASVTRRR